MGELNIIFTKLADDLIDVVTEEENTREWTRLWRFADKSLIAFPSVAGWQQIGLNDIGELKQRGFAARIPKRWLTAHNNDTVWFIHGAAFSSDERAREFFPLLIKLLLAMQQSGHTISFYVHNGRGLSLGRGVWPTFYDKFPTELRVPNVRVYPYTISGRDAVGNKQKVEELYRQQTGTSDTVSRAENSISPAETFISWVTNFNEGSLWHDVEAALEPVEEELTLGSTQLLSTEDKTAECVAVLYEIIMCVGAARAETRRRLDEISRVIERNIRDNTTRDRLQSEILTIMGMFSSSDMPIEQIQVTLVRSDFAAAHDLWQAWYSSLFQSFSNLSLRLKEAAKLSNTNETKDNLQDSDFARIPSPAASEKPSILVVDDDKQFQSTVAKVLQPTYSVIEASSPDDALKKMKPEIGAILLDIFFGSEELGVDALAQFRERYSHVPVIVVTASKRIDIREKCTAGGAFDYLKKTDSPETTVDIVKRALMGGALMAQLERFQQELMELKTRKQELENTLKRRRPGMNDKTRK